MSRTLFPRAAADLARLMRQATGGIDSNWLRLMISGSPAYLAALVGWLWSVTAVVRPRTPLDEADRLALEP